MTGIPASPLARILHLVHTPRHSGAESLVRDLCLIHTQQGFATAIASFAPPPQSFLSDADMMTSRGVSLFFPPSALSRAGRIRHYRNAYKSFKPDIVFAHSVLPSFYGRLALPLRKDRRPRFITVLHDASNDDFANGYLRMIELATRWRSDKIVAVSTQGAGNYRRRFGSCPPVEVISNGIYIGRFKNADRQAARRMLGLTEHSPKIILQVGRLSSVKQQDLSVRALSGLLARGKAQLWLAGLTEEPGYEHALRQAVVDLNLQDAVRFLGSRTDVPELLAAADLYVMPSRAEAHSIAILEALASGIPVIASDIPSFQMCRAFPGTHMIGIDDQAGFAKAAEDSLDMPRHDRDLSAYAIGRTAEAYISAKAENS